MKIDVFLFFQVVIEFWNKHFNNKHIKNIEIHIKPIRIRRYFTVDFKFATISIAKVNCRGEVKVITETQHFFGMKNEVGKPLMTLTLKH